MVTANQKPTTDTQKQKRKEHKQKKSTKSQRKKIKRDEVRSHHLHCCHQPTLPSKTNRVRQPNKTNLHFSSNSWLCY